MHALANWDRHLDDVLVRAGLRHLIGDAANSEQLGAEKPARACFDAFLDRNGLDPVKWCTWAMSMSPTWLARGRPGSRQFWSIAAIDCHTLTAFACKVCWISRHHLDVQPGGETR